MKRNDRKFLTAERSSLQRIISTIPEEEMIDRASYISRLSDIENQLAEIPEDERLPVSVRLTFRGKPVASSYGIDAEFGAKAASRFNDTITTMAASLVAPLSPMGPIPNKTDYQLLITGTAVGSFGFELEEADDGALFKNSTLENAVAMTQNLFASTIGSDDEMTEAAAGLDPRVIKSAVDFLNTLADNDAVCAVAVGEKSFRYADVGQVRRAIERLDQNNISEQNESFTGMFQGVLPTRRTFEFVIQPEGDVISGKIGASIQEPSQVNQHLSQPIAVTFTATKVGSGKPKYVLNVMPAWQ